MSPAGEAGVKVAEGVRLTRREGQLKMNSSMNTIINAKQLRASLPEVVAKVRRGERFTVLYRSRAAFQIGPVEGSAPGPGEAKSDSLYAAAPVGRSTDGRSAAEHDTALYGV